MNSLYLHLILIIVGVASAYGAHDSDECDDAGHRLCELDDLDCMGHYLASNSRCHKVKKGHVRDCVTFPRRTFLVPIVNSTVTVRRPEISGFKSAKVVAFYQNTTSSNLVLAFQMKNVEKEYRDTTVTIHRRAQESITFDNDFTITIGAITYTAVIPCLPSVDLSSATFSAYFDSPDIVFVDDTHYKDSTVRDTMSAVKERIVTAAMESMVTEARYYVQNFIQTRLCDFGLELGA